MHQHDLFSYPHAPGVKNRSSDTSRAAARRTARILSPTEALVMRELAIAPMTADEIADRLTMLPTQIRPRCSQLAARGKIIDTHTRRPNACGNDMIVYRVAT